ncbi:selenide, water dikinase SelD [Thalassovita mediterranea]|jgi:selenide,water dikinase|uniref:Selenide, water dikinase n=1 Tax=Thalassovita mediterranea TaxID=340021 RepID=A0A0P1GSH8_9RHOB|nr:selenide, water dikinase SelD [Thalassovita mediterranea]CUH85550.1 Selenide, water dikinase [Thalassovita mediterranea]SIS30198.1 selenophosphate synthase [Thalassovita mediterranea]
MQNSTSSDIPLTRDLVLIGGGHTHALVLRMMGMRPLPGLRITVINPGPTAPYTGMLPGHIAGDYTQDELEIDLIQLARFAGARVILGAADHIDPVAKTVHVTGHGVIAYDVASVDIGITSDLPKLPGFTDHAVPAKPLARYAAVWRDYLAAAQDAGHAGPVAVIGGGVAGVELALTMAHGLRQATGQADVTVLEAQDHLTGTSEATRKALSAKLDQAGVKVWSGAEIAEMTPEGPRLTNGAIVPAKLTIGAAGATPHPWLTKTALPLQDGFIKVGATLQVEGHEDLFASGDCAHLMHAPRPKAGVFAVRAAPVLRDNLEARLIGTALRRFEPQKNYLKLIALGGKSALAERWGRPISGPLLWRWKDRIDRTFMAQFKDLPVMEAPPAPKTAALGVADELSGGRPVCAGCGSKVGPGTLSAALQSLPRQAHKDVVQGAGDDAAVLQMGEVTQVISTDHLRAFSHDPALMARIAAVHALGDIWSMGARPQSALAQIILPRMSPTLQERTLKEVMAHAGAIFADAGAEVVGGHTTQGAEMTIGFTVTGTLAKGRQPIALSGARAGDALILTRPIGSGTLLAAEMQGRANGRHVAAMLRQMAEPQMVAAPLLAEAHAMTDVTGFGLAGHLKEICEASGTGAELWVKALPLYEGAEELAASGVTSTLFEANLTYAPVQNATGPRGMLLHDPQTAGGMLAAVAAEQADDILHRMAEAGVPARQIGTIVPGDQISCR